MISATCVEITLLKQDLNRSSRIMRLPLAIAFVILLVDVTLAQQTAVRTDWSLHGDTAVITYELVAPNDILYEVTVVLKREDDPSYSFVPKTVAGDVGKGKYAGGKREIRWNFRQDMPAGLEGSDYWFDVTATQVVEEGGIKWWLYAAGGAGVVVAAILASGHHEESGPAPSLPNPPFALPPWR